MGWASTLEDVIDRLNDAIHLLSDVDRVASGNEEIPRESIQSLIHRSHCVIVELQKLLAIATDPAIDMAEALADARTRIEELEALLSENERSNRLAERQREQIVARADKCSERARVATREVKRLEKLLESVMRSAPGKIYDAFPPDDTR